VNDNAWGDPAAPAGFMSFLRHTQYSLDMIGRSTYVEAYMQVAQRRKMYTFKRKRNRMFKLNEQRYRLKE